MVEEEVFGGANLEKEKVFYKNHKHLGVEELRIELEYQEKFGSAEGCYIIAELIGIKTGEFQ